MWTFLIFLPLIFYFPSPTVLLERTVFTQTSVSPGEHAIGCAMSLIWLLPTFLHSHISTSLHSLFDISFSRVASSWLSLLVSAAPILFFVYRNEWRTL
jgi:hypothetical protein